MRLDTLAVPALALVFGLAACDAGVEEGGEIAEETAVETGIGEEAALGETEPGARPAFADLDVNTNQQLEREEFQTVAGEGFGAWDTDAEAGLTEDELGTGLFGAWDADDSRFLDENEWNEGTELFGDEDFGTFGEWDANADAQLTEDEFLEGFRDTDAFATADVNNDDIVEENEWGDWWFDLWDTDDDQYLQTAEYDAGWNWDWGF